jgi:hypothetical protein
VREGERDLEYIEELDQESVDRVYCTYRCMLCVCHGTGFQNG